jgi:hypothetical protein
MEPLIIVRRWQLQAAEGHRAAAALLSFFEYWHNIKLDQVYKARQANDVAENHGDGRTQDEQLLQWHNEKELQEGVLLYGVKSIREGVEVLEKKGFIEVHGNPNPRYKFDKTKHFLFKPEEVNEWLAGRLDTDKAKLPIPSGVNGARQGVNGARRGENAATSTETTSETTSEVPVGAPATPDATSANKFTGYLADELVDADVPLLKGRKGRYGKDFKEQLLAGTAESILYKVADRIVERWTGDDHYKLSVEQAHEDVVNGKRNGSTGRASGGFADYSLTRDTSGRRNLTDILIAEQEAANV